MILLTEWRAVKESAEHWARRDISAPRTHAELEAAWRVNQTKLHLMNAERRGNQEAIIQCRANCEQAEQELGQAREARIAQAAQARDRAAGARRYKRNDETGAAKPGSEYSLHP